MWNSLIHRDRESVKNTVDIIGEKEHKEKEEKFLRLQKDWMVFSARLRPHFG